MKIMAVDYGDAHTGVAVSDREFHCRASWIFMNQGLPGEAELTAAAEFAKSVLNGTPV